VVPVAKRRKVGNLLALAILSASEPPTPSAVVGYAVQRISP
jgi:hypothetical protein